MVDKNKYQSKPFPLVLASEDEEIQIVLFRVGKHQEKRLTSMGLNVGRILRVVANKGRNMVVLSGETRIALGSNLSHKILVVNHH